MVGDAGRLTSQYPLLREVAGNAVPGGDEWCAAQYWLGRAAQFSADLAGALGHFTAACDAVADPPASRALTAALAGRASILRLMGRTAEAAGDARRSLVLAREIGDPVGELLALGCPPAFRHFQHAPLDRLPEAGGRRPLHL